MRNSTPRRYSGGEFKPSFASKNYRYIYQDKLVQDKKERICLRCDKKFLSINFMRICQSCKDSREFD
jgi:hypothetical protein